MSLSDKQRWDGSLRVVKSKDIKEAIKEFEEYILELQEKNYLDVNTVGTLQMVKNKVKNKIFGKELCE